MLHNEQPETANVRPVTPRRRERRPMSRGMKIFLGFIGVVVIGTVIVLGFIALMALNQTNEMTPVKATRTPDNSFVGIVTEIRDNADAQAAEDDEIDAGTCQLVIDDWQGEQGGNVSVYGTNGTLMGDLWQQDHYPNGIIAIGSSDEYVLISVPNAVSSNEEQTPLGEIRGWVRTDEGGIECNVEGVAEMALPFSTNNPTPTPESEPDRG